MGMELKANTLEHKTTDAEIQRKKNQEALALFRKWLGHQSGDYERTWPLLKDAIERDRLSPRKSFRE